MIRYCNFYRVESDRQGMVYTESYDTAEVAREKYEDAEDHPWLKYIAVAVPTVPFEEDGGLRK